MHRKRIPILGLIVLDLVLAALILFGFLIILHDPLFIKNMILRPQIPASKVTETVLTYEKDNTPDDQNHPVVTPMIENPASVPSSDLRYAHLNNYSGNEHVGMAPQEDTDQETIQFRIAGEEIGHYESKSVHILLTRHTKTEGKEPITFFVAEVILQDPASLVTAFPTTTACAWPEQLAKSSKAVLAVNGDYYTGIHNGLIVRNGEILQKNAGSSDLCVLYQDGTMEMVEAEEADNNEIIKKQPWQVWTFGPSLLTDKGKAKERFNTGRELLKTNPRTAIGYYEAGHYIFVVVDGRNPGYSNGMTMEQLARTFEDFRCQSAYNLDGGNSSCMVFQGKEVNLPSGGGRPVSDLVIIREENTD